MSILYDVYEIENAAGNGENRNFVRPLYGNTMSRRQLCDSISRNCSLKPSDIEATLTELGEVICEKLAEGHRFYLPEIGYFSLKVNVKRNEEKQKIDGNHLMVRSVGFTPEKTLVSRLRERVSFQKAKKTMRSRKYTDEEISGMIRSYLYEHSVITRRTMENVFNLRESKALRWLSRLVELGVIVKIGNKNSPIYQLKSPV